MATSLEEQMYGEYEKYNKLYMDIGKIMGETSKSRLTVLRGIRKGLSVKFLADLLDFPVNHVESLFKAYDEIYQLWENDEEIGVRNNISEAEVNYLLYLFQREPNKKVTIRHRSKKAFVPLL